MLTHYLFIYLKKEKWSPPTEIVVVLTQESTYFFSNQNKWALLSKPKIFCMIITNDCLSPRCVSSYTLPVEHKWKQQYLQMVFKWKKKKKNSLTNKTTVALTWYYNITPHWKTKMCVRLYTLKPNFQLVKLNAKVWLCPFSSVCVLWCAFVSLRTP